MRPASGDYEAQNEIAQYKHVNDPSAGQTGGAAVAPAALARPMPPAVPVARPMPPSPPVPQFAPPVQQFAPPVQQITEAQWNAQQAAIAAANAAAIAPAIVPTGWAPPDAPQPWATQPVQTTPQVMQNPPPDAQQAAPASQAVPPWMTQPTA